jgi:hypothetical protein
MYIGATIFLWLVRAWKIGELEKEALREHVDISQVDPVAAPDLGGLQAPAAKTHVTPFVKRMVMRTKV